MFFAAAFLACLLTLGSGGTRMALKYIARISSRVVVLGEADQNVSCGPPLSVACAARVVEASRPSV